MKCAALLKEDAMPTMRPATFNKKTAALGETPAPFPLEGVALHHETRGFHHETRGFHHEGCASRQENLAPQHENLAPQHENLAPQHEALAPQHEALAPQHETLEERPAEERGNDTPALSALEACTALALAAEAFLTRPAPPPERHERDFERKDKRFAASCDGFDVHCAVRIAKGDDQGRERLVRYCARPPFALDRIEVLSDGRVSYLLKGPRRGRTHRVMTPMELTASGGSGGLFLPVGNSGFDSSDPP
jgi:hypothetical protein